MVILYNWFPASYRYFIVGIWASSYMLCPIVYDFLDISVQAYYVIILFLDLKILVCRVLCSRRSLLDFVDSVLQVFLSQPPPHRHHHRAQRSLEWLLLR